MPRLDNAILPGAAVFQLVLAKIASGIYTQDEISSEVDLCLTRPGIDLLSHPGVVTMYQKMPGGAYRGTRGIRFD